MEIIFILVNPAVPENIGFSLRGLNTMGFTRMRIVGTIDIHAVGLRKTAYGSHDLIDNLAIFSSLQEAINDIDLVIGTTSKSRISRNDVIDSREILSFLEKKRKSVRRVAIVFGSEENGLSKEEINLCHSVSTIALQTDYPSLNLAQSVMIYAYELSAYDSKDTIEIKDEALFKILMDDGDEVMNWLEIDRNPALFQKMKDRLAMISDGDMRLFLTVLGKVRHRIKTGQNKDPETS